MAKEEQFQFLSADKKTIIHAVKWMPEQGEYRAVLQIVHGMTEYVERYRAFAEYLTEQGILVVGHDHLGHGASVRREADWGYFAKDHPSDVLVEDMHTLRVMVQKENPQIPYFMLGHSMGSYMLRKYLCIYPEQLGGAVIMGTGCVPDSAAKLGMFLCKNLAEKHGWYYRSKWIRELTYSTAYRKFDLTGKDITRSWLTKDTAVVEQYYADPKCTFLFTVNGYFGLFEAVYFDHQPKNIEKMPKNLPILLVSGAQDPVGDLGAGVKKVYHMYRRAQIRDLTCRLYENDRHELLNETDREKVFADIYRWMNRRIPKDNAVCEA